MLFVAFLWHMHQPFYLSPGGGKFLLPWVRLHGTKDYLKMSHILSGYPEIHATFNFTPSLLHQLALYGEGIQDEHQRLSLREAQKLTPPEKEGLLESGFTLRHKSGVDPFPRYKELMKKRRKGDPFSVQEWRDLQVWSNLSWISPHLRREHPFLRRLLEKGASFSEEEKRELLSLQVSLLQGIVPAYRALEEKLQVELTTSPFSHPILPLLFSGEVFTQTNPDLPRPSHPFHYPEDASWHLTRAVEEHTRFFGKPPRGLWPSEGSLSEEILPILSEAHFQWAATDEELLWKSLRLSKEKSQTYERSFLYQPFSVRRGADELHLLFRDRVLSDLIGFSYSAWPAEQAAADFVRRIEKIGEKSCPRQPPPLVLVALDGENPWESYPEDGEPFLNALYGALATRADIRCCTVSEYLALHPPKASLSHLAPGSWIRGEFSTWMGHPAQNRAWEELLLARRLIGPERSQAMAAAQGSDWFWWFGPEHSSLEDPVFDRLFRENLKKAYQEAGAVPPPQLDEPIKKESRQEPPSMAPPTGFISPLLDGKATHYFEWLRAGELDLKASMSFMARGRPIFSKLWWGRDRDFLYLRLDPVDWLRHLDNFVLRFAFKDPLTEFCFSLGEGELLANSVKIAGGKILEAAFPFQGAGLQWGEFFTFAIQVEQEGFLIERYPEEGSFTLPLPRREVEGQFWSA